MNDLRRVRFEMEVTNHYGGYNREILATENNLYSMCGFVVEQQEDAIILALGVSNTGALFHQIRIPMRCIKGDIIEQDDEPVKQEPEYEVTEEKPETPEWNTRFEDEACEN